MSARDRILARLGDGLLATDAAPDLSVHLNKQYSDDEKLDLFQSKLESVHGEVHRVARGEWATKLAEIVTENGFANLIAGSGELADQALDAVSCETRRYDQAIEAFKGELFANVACGFTTCRGGIAETGSLVLWPSAEEPRLLSLVPPVHIALLDGKTIRNTLTETVTEERWKDGMPTNALLISGPSKSADIAQVLAYGVHGPKRLIVLLITE